MPFGARFLTKQSERKKHTT